MSSKQAGNRWIRLGRRNSASFDGPIMGVIPVTEDDMSRASASGRERGMGKSRASFRKQKSYVPKEELSSLVALPPTSSTSARSIKLVPEDFPSLSIPTDKIPNISSHSKGSHTSGRTNSKRLSRSQFIPPTKVQPSTLDRECSRSLKSNNGSDRPTRSLADGDFEISVFHKPSFVVNEEFSKEIKIRDADNTDTTESSTPLRRRHEETDQSRIHGPSSPGQDKNPDSLEFTLSFDDSPTTLIQTVGHNSTQEDRVALMEEEKRQAGLVRDRSITDASWRTGMSSKTFLTDGTGANASHISVKHLEVEGDVSPGSRGGRWLSQHSRWEESTLDLTTVSDLGASTKEFEWSPPEASSFRTSSRSMGKAADSRRSLLSGSSLPSMLSMSRHLRLVDMPRKPRHPKETEPSREIEWTAISATDVPPSESKSGQNGRRSRPSQARTEDIEISWTPSKEAVVENTVNFDHSPVKPSRHWQPPPGTIHKINEILEPTDDSCDNFDRMMEMAIQRSVYET